MKKIVLFTLVFFLFSVKGVAAVSHPTKTPTPTPTLVWCHKEGIIHDADYDLKKECVEEQKKACYFPWKAGKCPTPTPTVTPTPTPTPEITITPTPTEEITPTPTPEDKHDGPTWSPRVDFSWHEPVCVSAFKPKDPLLQGLKRIDATTVELGWWPIENADHYAIIYGYYGEPMSMGWPRIEGNQTGFRINFLRPNTRIHAKLYVWANNCVSESAEVDP